MHAGGKYIQLQDTESQQVLELNYYPPGTKHYEEYCEGSELDHLAFLSENVEEDYKHLIAAGATSAILPWNEGNWTLAFVRDPDGIWIELIGKKHRPTTPPQKETTRSPRKQNQIKKARQTIALPYTSEQSTHCNASLQRAMMKTLLQ